MAPTPDDFDMGQFVQTGKDTREDVREIKKTLEKWESIPFKVRILWKYGWILAAVILIGTIKMVFNVPMPWAGG